MLRSSSKGAWVGRRGLRGVSFVVFVVLVALCGGASRGASVLSRGGSLGPAPFGQQGAKLLAPWGFGSAVSLSADGGTAVVGAPGANDAAGLAFVYVWTGSGWIPQGTLTPAGASGASA